MSTLRELWQKAYRSLFGDIREGEEKSVYTLLSVIFLLLVGYYIIKTVREPLILASGGAELKSYAAAAQAAVLLFLVPLYSYLTSRVDRKTLIIVVTLFFVGCIQFFFFGSQMNEDRTALLQNEVAYESPFDGPPTVEPEQPLSWDTAEEPEITFEQRTPNRSIFALFLDMEQSLESRREAGSRPGKEDGANTMEGTAADGSRLSDLITVEVVTLDGETVDMKPAAFSGRNWIEAADARFTFKPQAKTHQVTISFEEDVGIVKLVGVQKARWPWLGFAFYVWVGIFSVAIISLFWSYSNDVFHRDAGERLFPVIAIGATAGAPVGSFIAGRLFDAGIAPFAMLQITAGLLLLSLLLYQFVEQAKSETTDEDGETRADEEISGSSLGFDLLFKSRYLVYLALLMLILNLVNTNGEYLLGKMVENWANLQVSQQDPSNPDALFSSLTGGFYGDFYSIVNVVAFLLQAFLVSRIVKYLGIKGVLFALPIIAFGTYAIAAFGFGLAVFRWGKTAENATDYSVMNTGKAILWLPTTREEKYKAKQAVDTFVVRFGDMISAGFVFLGTQMLSVSVEGFAGINLVLIVLWLILTFFIVKRYRELAEERDKDIDLESVA